MQVWSMDWADEWILAREWLQLRYDRRIRPVVAVRAFGGGYDRSGDVAANMVELFLTELTNPGISAGLIRVQGRCAPDLAPIQVFCGLARAAGADYDVKHPEGQAYFCDTYDSILLLLAWCLSCEWEVDFVAADRKFAITCEEDGQVTVFWDEGESMLPSAEKALTNNEYVPVWGTKAATSERPADG